MTVAGAMIGFVLLIGIFCLVLRIWRPRRQRRNLSFSWRRRDPSTVLLHRTISSRKIMALVVVVQAVVVGSSMNLNSGENSTVENLEPTTLMTAPEEEREGEVSLGSGEW
ncbi:unnamed protein product [Linum trigynum]|uniref:Transmembrane protein n=1 Tax=Linum trigynum TaxID=586398 RepID=A0AAV2DP11_9ROSI